MTNAVLDKETFCRLVEEHQSALYRTARSILSNQQDAEDAVQEAVCAAYSHLAGKIQILAPADPGQRVL